MGVGPSAFRRRDRSSTPVAARSESRRPRAAPRSRPLRSRSMKRTRRTAKRRAGSRRTRTGRRRAGRPRPGARVRRARQIAADVARDGCRSHGGRAVRRGQRRAPRPRPEGGRRSLPGAGPPLSRIGEAPVALVSAGDLCRGGASPPPRCRRSIVISSASGRRARAGSAVRARPDVPAARASPGRNRCLAPASARVPGIGLRGGRPPASRRAVAVSIGPRRAARVALLLLSAAIGRTAAAAPERRSSVERGRSRNGRCRSSQSIASRSRWRGRRLARRPCATSSPSSSPT